MAYTGDCIGYMYLAEGTSPEENSIKNLLPKTTLDGTKYAQFDTILHTFRVNNRNRRKYWGPNVDQQLHTERILSLLADNAWYGEMDHPLQITADGKLTPERVRTIYMPNRSHKIMNPSVKGDILTATIQTASGSEPGKGFYNELMQGLVPGFSCRSIAAIETVNGEPYVMIKFLVTYDWVLYPSHKEAHKTGDTKYISKQEKVISESSHNGFILPGGRKKFTEDVVLSLKELIDFTSETDNNIRAIMESFELPHGSFIGFDNPINHAIIKDDDNTIFVNISPKTKKEVRSFLSSF